MKILHFAIENYARVPSQLVNAEKELGHDSYLMTLYPSPRNVHDEDYCLNMPFVANRFVKSFKKFLNPFQSPPAFYRRDPSVGTPLWKPHLHEKVLFNIRDSIWDNQIRKYLDKIHIHTFDLLILDGGAGFLRNGNIVSDLKKQGLKIAILYCGSDLRTRGRIPNVDDLADYRFTVEHDHTLLYPGIQFLYFPFQLPEQQLPLLKKGNKVRIGHSPTKRKIKGTDIILQQLSELQKIVPVEIVLIENLPFMEALQLKQSCDLFIEAIGELGYGISGLEALAMGIPSAVELMPDFEEFLGDHPFVNISRDNIGEALIPFIKSKEKRVKLGEKGKIWVKTHHDPVRVSSKMLSVMGLVTR
ncbi:glycosyltransferase [bacterium]